MYGDTIDVWCRHTCLHMYDKRQDGTKRQRSHLFLLCNRPSSNRFEPNRLSEQNVLSLSIVQQCSMRFSLIPSTSEVQFLMTIMNAKSGHHAKTRRTIRSTPKTDALFSANSTYQMRSPHNIYKLCLGSSSR